MRKKKLWSLLLAAAMVWTTTTAAGFETSEYEVPESTVWESTAEIVEAISGEETYAAETMAEETVIEESMASESTDTGETVMEETVMEETTVEEIVEETIEEIPAAVALQEQITALPAPEEYDYLSRAEKREVAEQADRLKKEYYETLTEEERELVDVSHLFALDLYTETYAFYQTEEEYAGQLTLEDVPTTTLSNSQLQALQKDIDALPDLSQVADVSGITVNGKGTARELPAAEHAMSYAEDPESSLLSDAQVDQLYPEVYDAAAAYYQLEPEQAEEVQEADLADLVSYFSVGVARYSTVSAGIGQIDGFSMQRYTGKLAKSSMKFGYYQVNTQSSNGSRMAFCMDSTLYSPGREGTTLVTETECTNREILTILYYGYGGPGELVGHDLNGYCETHMAICHAVDGKSVNKSLSSAAYKKLYTNVPDKTVHEKVRAWMVESATAGRQTLIYPVFLSDEPEQPVPETPTEPEVPTPQEPAPPTEGEMELVICKKDADTKLAQSSAGASLAGAVFALEYWPEGADLSGEPKQRWEYRTGADGGIAVDKKAQWPLGTYRLRETVPPSYYRLEGYLIADTSAGKTQYPVTTGMTWQLAYDAAAKTVGIQLGSEKISSGRLEISAYDKVHRGTIQVKKKGEGSKTLSGAVYRLFSVTENRDCGTNTTGADGLASWTDLPYGRYVLTEITAPAGYELLKESISITLPITMTAEEVKSSGADTSKGYYDGVSQSYVFDTQTYEITDSRRLTIPMAGGDGDSWFRWGIPSLALILIGWRRLRSLAPAGAAA